MPKYTTITCAECGNSHTIPLKEYNRQLRNGRKRFFCSLNCTARAANRPWKKPNIKKSCPHCGSDFITPSTKSETTYCCQSCAGKEAVARKETVVVTERMREAGRYASQLNFGETYNERLINIANNLRKREWPRYQPIHDLLNQHGLQHRFEVPLEQFIYDLYIYDYDLFIEFDEPKYHNTWDQMERDLYKSGLANVYGCRVVRLGTADDGTIDPQLVLDTIYSLPVDDPVKIC